jgi:hypothetical protein
MSSYCRAISGAQADAKAIAEDIKKLFNTEKFSDVRIICGNETFLCHKNILATMSQVFAAMFDSITGSTENQNNVVRVDDFDAKTMKNILEFIYGSKFDDKEGNIDLQLARNKYSLPNKAKCMAFYVIGPASMGPSRYNEIVQQRKV